MKAIILAAGTGSRLMPSNPNTPKCLVDLGGTPLLERMVSTLRYCEIGFESIYLVAGFNFEMVSRAMEKFDGIHILKNEDYLTKDNMSSLDIALCALPKMNEEIAIMNGDTLHQKSLARRFFEGRGNLILAEKGKTDSGSMLVSVSRGRVMDISMEIPVNDCYGTSANLFMIDTETAPLLAKTVEGYRGMNRKGLWFEAAIKDLLPKSNFFPIDTMGENWIEIDTPSDLLEARKKTESGAFE